MNAKTVERWINSGRIPHRETRWLVAQALDVDEVYLWPELLAEPTPDQRVESVESELVRVYPDRASVPRDVWLRLFGGATRQSTSWSSPAHSSRMSTRGSLTCSPSGQQPASRMRLCWADPSSQAVDIRDREEGLRGTLAHKIRAALTYYRPLIPVAAARSDSTGSASMPRCSASMTCSLPTRTSGARRPQPTLCCTYAGSKAAHGSTLPAQLRRGVGDRHPL